MDSGVSDANGVTNCNGSRPYTVEVSREAAEEDDGESKSLLPPANGGGIGKKQQRQRSSRRRVQWNDRNGNKLVEVLEYQPSDSSDSEDEYDPSLATGPGSMQLLASSISAAASVDQRSSS